MQDERLKTEETRSEAVIIETTDDNTTLMMMSEPIQSKDGFELSLETYASKNSDQDIEQESVKEAEPIIEDPECTCCNKRLTRRRYATFVIVLVLFLAAAGVALGLYVSNRLRQNGNTSSAAIQSTESSPSAEGSEDSNTTTSMNVEEEIEGLLNETIIAVPIHSDVASGEGNASTMSPVMEVLLQNAIFNGNEFQDLDSYQNKAAQWVDTTYVLGANSTARILQLYALACLYYATNGVRTIWSDEVFGYGVVREWIDTTGWLEFENECDWYQILCNDEGFVSEISLYSNRLSGSLPPELQLLSQSLETIDVYNNPIHNSGEAGHNWLGELSNLKTLFYGRSYFESSDGIPKVIGKLSKLEEYDCSETLYSGPLKGEEVFARTTNLNYLVMSGTNFNSSIPSELAMLPNLEFLYADEAGLSGNLSFLAAMPSIKELWIDRNYKMKGSIPSEIGFVSTLQSLSITNIGLEGTLPSEMGLLPLKQFWAYSNGGLRGTIPTELGQLNQLVRMSLVKTSLTGTMPEEVCSHSTLYGGPLAILEADCQVDGGRVACPCCSCCGSVCIAE